MSIKAPIPELVSSHASDVGIYDSINIENKSTLDRRVLTAVTPPQWRIVEAIRRHYVRFGLWPSGCAVSRAVGRSLNATTRQIRRLERIGVLRWADASVSILREPDGVFSTVAQVRL